MHFKIKCCLGNNMGSHGISIRYTPFIPNHVISVMDRNPVKSVRDRNPVINVTDRNPLGSDDKRSVMDRNAVI